MIVNVQRLRTSFVVPVLGSVSSVLSVTTRRWRVAESICFIAVCLALFAAYGGLVAFEGKIGAVLGVDFV